MSDLISRKAAIDAIKALWDGAPTAQHVSAMFDCEDAIQALPSADPVKHGWWIEHIEGDYFWYICSSCGKVSYMVDDIHAYCPNCGAYMMDEVEK